MKKLLLFLFFIPALVRSQTTNTNIATLPIFTGNIDSAKVVGSINGLSKNFWGIDLKRGVVKYTDTALMFSGYLRLSALAPYLLASTAASTYQPLGSYLTNTTGDARYYTKTLADARYLQSETDPKRIVSIAVTGTGTKTITATLADATTVTTTFTDLQGTGGGSFTFTGTSSQYVAGDGSYVTFPTIPTTTSQLTNNSGFITSSSLSPYLTSATAASTYATQSSVTRTYTFALGIGGNVSTGTSVTNQLIIEKTGTISKAWINAKTAPTGADLIVDINLNGSTIWSTQTNRLKLAANATTGSQTSFNTVAVTAGDILTIDVDQIGSTVAGSNVTIQLVINQQ
jgi:hypothetical protein